MLRTRFLVVVLLIFVTFPVFCQPAEGFPNEKDSFNPATVLWYRLPASKWEEALPVGNGRLGAMVFGKADEERIQLNEDTYWSGGPYSTVVRGGSKALPEIQRLIFEGEVIKAHKLFGRHLMGYPVEQQKYQALANLHMDFGKQTETNDYVRWLDLETGISGVKYKTGDAVYTREVFSSFPDQVIVIRLTADKPGKISFTASLRGVRNSQMSNYATDYFRMDGLGGDQLVLTGKSADYLGIEGRVRYEARIKAIPEGGKMRMDDAELIIEDADAVTLYFVAATNFVSYKNLSADQHHRIENYLDGLNNKSFEEIRKRSVADHKSLFGRVSLALPVTDGSRLPTDERMKKINDMPDPSLAALSYQFGRYILIASSRPGTQPANLQGIWNQDMNPMWDSKYTTNINTEMNYWPAESSNLAECAEPLFNMIRELTDQGSQVARDHYGAGGWVFHQNTDIWRVAAPMDGPAWGTFTVGGAWLCTHLWEHWLFTRDITFLKEAYPLIKGSVEFFMDFLIPDPSGKWLVTNPSTSPENPPEGKGYKYFFDEVTAMYYFTTICYGSSIDMQILKDLFSYFCEASSLLNADREFALKVKLASDRLVPPGIGKDGSLKEWTEDLGQAEKSHRHFSHMYGLYPGNVISKNKTPELVDACVKVLEQRGDGGTGFSRAWKMALWARLNDGNRANSIFKGYLKDQAYPQLFAKCFTPLQVDGSLGVTAAITEMLIQSHEGVIELLPALPAEWSDGSFSGVCARGAFEISFEWENERIKKVNILSKAGELCRIKTGEMADIRSGSKKIPARRLKGGITEFKTIPGSVYTIKVRVPD